MSEAALATPLGGTHLELWELVRAEIRRLIISGEFTPGQRLVEATLAERFEVSRGPVRTALMELERVGLVTSVPRKGIQVAVFDRSDVHELLTVAVAIERVAAAEAARRATVEQVQGLRQKLDELDEAQRNGDRAQVVEADLALHSDLVKASGNRRLYRLWMDMSDQIRFVSGVAQRVLPQVEWARYNQPIVDAIEQRDPELAERAVESCYDGAHEEIMGLSAEAFDIHAWRTRGS
jgi:DNA-binding GntR family transcriptional regulator